MVCLLALSLALTSGCAAIPGLLKDAVTGGGGPSIDANIAKGDAKGEGSTAQNANTAVAVSADDSREEVYNGTVESVINESPIGMGYLFLIVILAGWAIPSPGEMIRETVRLFRELRRGPPP